MALVQIVVVLMAACIWSGNVQGDDFLKNGRFELGPENAPVDLENPKAVITSLPYWQVQGIVTYLVGTQDISVPDGGHAIELGQNGGVSQVLTGDKSGSLYSLTFSMGTASDNCSDGMRFNVSVPPFSTLFELSQFYSAAVWETYAWGFLSSGFSNLSFINQPAEADPSNTCGPLLDTVVLKEISLVNPQQGNLLVNGDFEEGPYILPESPYGVLLPPNSNLSLSPIPGWTVGPTRPVKYIDASHFAVPQGFGAIELVWGDSQATIQQTVRSEPGKKYRLSFNLGDANNNCKGNLIVRVGAGILTEDVGFGSSGDGKTERYQVNFVARKETSLISFASPRSHTTSDASFCGPVVDNVVLVESGSARKSVNAFTLALLAVFLVLGV